MDDNVVANHIKDSSIGIEKDKSIGIEIVNEGYSSEQYTTQQYTSLHLLLNYLTGKYSIPYDNKNILAHYEV